MLARVGLEHGITYESIVSTLNSDGTTNVAPMGVRVWGSLLALYPFMNTTTYCNLLSKKVAVTSFTDDPLLFLNAAFKDEIRERVEFIEANYVKAQRLAVAESFVELQVISINTLKEKATVLLRPIHSELMSCKHKPYCRGKFAALESIIHATRVKVFLQEERKEEANLLISRIEAYRDLTVKVAPNSPYASVMDKIISLIDHWKRSSKEV